MSYAVMAFAVDASAVRAVVGQSGGWAARRLLRQPQFRAAARYPVAMKVLTVPGYVRSAEALDHAHELAEVLMGLCDTYGTFLDNQFFSAMRLAWFDRVDEDLEALGVTFRTRWFVESLGALDFPSTGEFPCLCEIGPEDAGQYEAQLQAADLTGIEPEVADAIRQLTGWFSTVSDEGKTLVTFYA